MRIYLTSEKFVPEIKNVVIQGAGALGTLYASKFHDTGQFSVGLIASGVRYERLKTNGILVNGQHYRIPVIHPEDDLTCADLIIVALKHHYLLDAVQDLTHIVGENTIIISVMNGIDSEEIIGSVYGMDKLLYCIAVGMDALREGNQTTYQNSGKLFFGEAENIEISPRVRRVQIAFDKASLRYETPPDMIRKLWWKFMVNVGVNQTSVAMQATYGVFQTSAEAQALMEASMLEVIELAKHAGVDLTEKDIDDWYPFLNGLSPQGKTSMLQDIEAGRKTEIEIFAGKVVELGRLYGIPMPVNQTLLQIVQVLEMGDEQIDNQVTE
jgi:2-dehydropantoate 2-reductase